MKLSLLLGGAMVSVLLLAALILKPSDRGIDPTASALVELYEYGGPQSIVPITLRIPREFRFGSSVGGQKSLGINILTFYPKFTSAYDTENVRYAQGGGCVGYCNGQILVSIKNRVGSKNPDWVMSYYSRGEMSMLEGHRPKLPHVQVVDLAAEHGFDFVFDEIVPKKAPLSSWRTRSLLAGVQWGNSVNFVAHCSMWTPYQACQLDFYLTCNPSIYVEIHGWLYEHMDEAFELRRRVDRFISAMVKDPKCEL